MGELYFDTHFRLLFAVAQPRHVSDQQLRLVARRRGNGDKSTYIFVKQLPENDSFVTTKLIALKTFILFIYLSL